MKYEVIGRNDIYKVKECLLENRGITDIKTYCNLTDDCLIPYNMLNNMDKAVNLLLSHIRNENSYITIVVDSDCDGYTSAAILYSYLRDNFPEVTVDYAMHTGKQHGLSDDITIPPQTTLIVLPDGGTNDTEQCQVYTQKGMQILILDHHIQDKDNPYATIVNNQISENYSNKELCGAGIVYKFLQAVDEAEWVESADNYLDLVALGNIGDMMDIKSYETKYLIQKGLSKIHNKCLSAMIQAQDYSIKGHINIHALAFYITPLLNAMCRCGSMEDKDLVFRALIETDEVFDYKKRGQLETIKETIYDRAARLCKNTKARQDKAVQNILPDLKTWIELHNANDNPIMFVKANDISSTYTGLVAMKLADYYHKPCLLLRKNSLGVYSGSGRNCDNSPFDSLKETLVKTNMFEFCQGHDGAFGFQIDPSKVSQAIDKICSDYADLDFGFIKVDFEIDFDDFNIQFIQDIDNLKDYYGTGIKEPKVVITNIILQKNQGVIIGDGTTWKFITDDNIAFIKFKCDEDDLILTWLNSKSNNDMIITALCEVGFNDYNDVITPRVKIIQYEVI